MVGIPGEAILFDMYYGLKGPLPRAGEQAGTMVEIPAVTEETPRFQNFVIRNVHVNGAEKGIFFRGLPEMSIKNILIEHANIVANKGVELIEAADIVIKGLTLKTAETNPLIQVDNSKNVLFEDLNPIGDVNLLINISGMSTEDVVLKHVVTKDVQQVSAFTHNAQETALTIE